MNPKTADQINSEQVGKVDYEPMPPSIGSLLRRIGELEKDLSDCRSSVSDMSRAISELEAKLLNK